MPEINMHLPHLHTGKWKWAFAFGVVAVAMIAWWPTAALGQDSPEIGKRLGLRMLDAAKLYHVLVNFHPTISSNDLDHAFKEHGLKLVETADSAEFSVALSDLVERLGDPGNFLFSPTEYANCAENCTNPFSWIAPGTLKVEVTNETWSDNENWERLEELAVLSDSAKALVFDFTNADWLASSFGWEFLNSSAREKLVTGQVRYPKFMFRIHTGSRSGSYSVEHSTSYFSGERVREVELYFIVNNRVGVPDFASALAFDGQACLISEEVVTTGQTSHDSHLDLPMWNGQSVRIRTSQHESIDGSALQDLVVRAESPIKSILSEDLKCSFSSDPNPNPPSGESRQVYHSGSNFPEKPERLVAALAFWSTITKSFVYKDLADTPWDSAFVALSPAILMADDSLAYNLAVARLLKQIDDSHGLVMSETMSSYVGDTHPPVYIREVETDYVIGGFPSHIDEGQMQIGDILKRIDGKPIKERITLLSDILSASTEERLRTQIAFFLPQGARNSKVSFQFERTTDNSTYLVELNRTAGAMRGFNYRSGPIDTVLAHDIGYVDLDKLRRQDVDLVLDQQMDNKVIIFDMRGYPKQTQNDILRRIVKNPEHPSVLMETPIQLGAEPFTEYSRNSIQRAPSPSQQGHWKGQCILLSDARAISQAEHLMMHFVEGANCKVVGSNSSGTNGAVRTVDLPGNITIRFTGNRMRFADGRQLQRIGILPDVLVRPTLSGLASGRDEVLERAIEYARTFLD